MRILIAYATTEGQTGKIARFAMTHLSDAGHTVELIDLANATDVELSRYDGAVLMASVHAGAYQPALLDFATTHAAQLAKLPHVFCSVSLSAAGDDPEDWAGLTECITRLSQQSGWTPAKVEHIAGAFRFSEYNWFKTWAMRWIASQKGEPAIPGKDIEYTDWSALGKILDDWTASLDTPD